MCARNRIQALLLAMTTSSLPENGLGTIAHTYLGEMLESSRTGFLVGALLS